jgi:hypothetical protein
MSGQGRVSFSAETLLSLVLIESETSWIVALGKQALRGPLGGSLSRTGFEEMAPALSPGVCQYRSAGGVQPLPKSEKAQDADDPPSMGKTWHGIRIDDPADR